MQEPLVIYIENLSEEIIYWYANNEIVHGSLSQLTDTLNKSPVETTLIISGQNVLNSFVELENLNSSQFRKAAPYALEEQLIKPIQSYHFAYSPKSIDHKTFAVAIDANSFDELLQRFPEERFYINQCLIDYLQLPLRENCWSMTIYKHMALVRTSEYSGFSIQKEHLNPLMELTLAKTPLPESIDIYYCDTKPNIENSPNITLNYYKVKSQSPLSFFINNSQTKEQPINLLQGKLTKGSKAQPLKKAWYLAAATFAFWLITVGTLSLFNYFYFSYQEATLATKINKIYKETFPQATSIVSPKIRMQRELATYNNQSSDSGFLSILEGLGPILKNYNNIQIKTMSFQNKSLQLTINAPSFSILEDFSKALKAAPLSAKQTNAATKANKVLASFTISNKGKVL